MLRIIMAFLAFNVYMVILITAFKINSTSLAETVIAPLNELTGYLHQDNSFKAHPQKNWQDSDWNGHYLWWLFSSVISTMFAALLAGSIVRKNGGKVAAILNIPYVIILGFTFYSLFISGSDVKGRTGFMIVSIIAIPLTTFVAYLFGLAGEKSTDDDTILGIRPYHWTWITLPIFLYAICIISAIVVLINAIQLQNYNTWTDGIIWLIAFPLILMPIWAWVIPLAISYQILLSHKSIIFKLLVNTSILIGGYYFALKFTLACYWLVKKYFYSWF